MKPALDWTGKMKGMAGTDKNPSIVRIPDVIRIAPIAAEPQIIIDAFHVEHIQVTVGISNV